MAERGFMEAREAEGRVQAGETTIDAEARRYTLAELGEWLRHTRAGLLAVTTTWSDAQLSAQPAGGSGENAWSASEAITHLVATENWYLLHMTRLLGRKEHFDVMVRGRGDLARNGVPGAQLTAELRATTDRMLSEVAAIPADADLNATRDSTFFGDLSLRGWVLLAVIHDMLHYDQISQTAAANGFAMPA
ncbi:MAG TPA: DinB family protein [Ktedonobacterales bacterium]|nr:DinB family protein [Ktedonobacterales bacterium]